MVDNIILSGAAILSAYILDLIVGDPLWFPHPVIYIGRLIGLIQRRIRKIMPKSTALKIGGGLLFAATVIITGIATMIVHRAALRLGFYAAFFIDTIIICTCFSNRCLANEAMKVYRPLKSGDLEGARHALSFIVGRDTRELKEGEIIRAAVETVAENFVDGFISPLFYAIIFGTVGAMTYKAINTLDSMVGYKDEKYRDIGMVSARMDDVANFIPARISVIFIMLASLILKPFIGTDIKSSYKIVKRDRRNHTSPNCAYPEGAFAGAMGVRLGGTNTYFGKEVYKPTIGDERKPLEAEDVKRACVLMYVSSAVTMVLCIMVFDIIRLSVNIINALLGLK